MTDRPESAPAQAALERLAAALDPREYVTTLITGRGHPPRLTVTSRHAQFGDDIYVAHAAFWWSWAERIAAVDDPLIAAQKVTNVLRTAPERTRRLQLSRCGAAPRWVISVAPGRRSGNGHAVDQPASLQGTVPPAPRWRIGTASD
jgi:hypothetical protein